MLNTVTVLVFVVNILQHYHYRIRYSCLDYCRCFFYCIYILVIGYILISLFPRLISSGLYREFYETDLYQNVIK